MEISKSHTFATTLTHHKSNMVDEKQQRKNQNVVYGLGVSHLGKIVYAA